MNYELLITRAFYLSALSVMYAMTLSMFYSVI